MRRTGVRLLALLAVVLAALSVVACGGGGVAATPTLAPSPTATAEPTATPTATRTPTRTRTPTPTASPAMALLREARGKQSDLKSYRGEMEMVMDIAQRGLVQSITVHLDVEVAEPDMHVKMQTEGAPGGFDMEMVAKGDVLYMRLADEWSALPASPDRKTQSRLYPVDDEQLQAFLAVASNATMAGRRQVKGVECDVITFSVPWERALELARLAGNAPAGDLSDAEVNFEQLEGEVAIGVEDKIVRQLGMRMSGHSKANPAERFALDFAMTIWDINANDMVIEAPAGVGTPVAR